MSKERKLRTAKAVVAPPLDRPPRALYGAGHRLRTTLDEPLAGVLTGLTYLAPPDDETTWRTLKLDEKTLDKMPPARLLELLTNISPEISLALWQFNRLCNPGFDVKAYTLGSSNKTVNTLAQAAVDAFLTTLGDLYGSIDTVIAKLFTNAWLRGGFFAELVLDDAGRMPIDLATPDARWLNFRRELDPQRGPIWIPYQWQGSRQVRVDVPTVRYVPIDPLPGSPYGRALVSPAVHVTIFTLALLHDLRRVVQQQGWPRLSIKLDLEQLLKVTPPDIQGDPDRLRAWLDDVADGVGKAFSQLSPDDTYVHTSAEEIGGPHGAVDSSSLGAVDGLIEMLERMAVRGLKSSNLLMGLTDRMTESAGNRLYELHVQAIKSIQHLAEGLLEYLLELGLRAQGIQAVVEWRFAENRASELLRDAQTQKLVLQNAAMAYWLGIVSADEMANMALGREKADQPEPRIEGAGIQGGGGGGGGATNPENVQADPGVNRSVEQLLADAEPLAESHDTPTNGHASKPSRR
jgi:hypothetical protein